MNTVLLPAKETWPELCRRPSIGKAYLENAVRDILYRVKTEKDEALRFYSRKFDGSCPDELRVTEKEINVSASMVPQDLKDSIEKAKGNIEKFHASQAPAEKPVETTPGVSCWRKNVAIDKVGLYIPGGSAPLFSTLLMLGIPAKIAGCREIIVCTPAGKDGSINATILYTAKVLGITRIFKVGGAQAIAAMAYGTESVPSVYKIFGPGNQYVTKAKQIVQDEGIAIDMPAGPSEVLVIADETADSSFIASDLISQAEHGPDSQVIFTTTDQGLLEKVREEIKKQTETLSRKEIIRKSLENSKLVLLSSIDHCIEFSNLYAPEHLIINTSDPKADAEKVTNAGSVFLGRYSCESMGDYASGTNHTLPTNGYARNYSGVSAESFIKKITFQEVSANGLKELGPSVEIMAGAESLEGHRNAVALRLNTLKNV
ncbi:MAG TPA: histidinol dehydrogenase [Bacteroidales bacterium]|nr:histidinol dehydrogenase [Bacteroidales bacterium]